jgi:hypothetical protein
MEQFSADLKEHHSEGDDLTRIEDTLQGLISSRVNESDGFALSPVSRFPAKIAILMQVGLRRTIELTEAAIREANRVSLVSTSVLTGPFLRARACFLM